MARAPVLRHFGRRTDGVAAVEFAIIFPVLILLMLGGTELVAYVSAVRKVEAATSSISEMLSQVNDPANPPTVYVTAADLHFAYDQTMVVFPYVMKDAARQSLQWWQDITIDLASIQFIGNGKVCTALLAGTGLVDQSTCYVANVVWTTTGSVAGTSYRPCGIQLATTSGLPNSGSIPSNIFGPGSVIAVDVSFNFTPAFGASFFGTRRIARSVFVQPRYASLIDFNPAGNDGIATKCP